MQVSSTIEELMFTTVRMETRYPDGTTGAATSFIFSVERDGKTYPFLVTNKHAIANVPVGFLSFTIEREGQPALGEIHRLQITNFANMWIQHPAPEVDIAVAPLVPLLQHLSQQGIKVFFRQISSDLIPTETDLQSLDALEDILFIGYPNALWDTKNNLPVMRRGITATPISIDFQGRPQFLVDVSMFPGLSGSPVFIYNTGSFQQKGNAMVVGSRIFFLGVIASLSYRQEGGRIELVTLPTTALSMTDLQKMINLAVVFKARTVLETVEKSLTEQQARG